jgi:cytochrome c556
MRKALVYSSVLATAMFAVAMLFPTGIRHANAQAEAKSPGPYAPGLGDFMTAYVQPHHIKLWLAGNAANWKVAEYEAGELRETFDDVMTYQAVWHGLPVSEMVKSILIPPLTAVDEAIKNRNSNQFRAAYEKLTAACTACHKAANHDFIVIKVPKVSDFPDQEFRPQ